MRSEQEVKEELERLCELKDEKQLRPGEPLYGEPYLEALCAINKVEKGARIRILRWVLGAERS